MEFDDEMVAPASEETQVTLWLQEWRSGNEAALQQLLPLVYDTLHRLANSYIRKERPDHTLQPTALINEAYVRLVSQSVPDFQNRAHFFGVAAQLMRQVLVDAARRHTAAKRGGGAVKVDIENAVLVSSQRATELLALDEALEELGKIDPRKSRAVELKYFGGLQLEEIAVVLDVSVPTVNRELRTAHAWLRHRLSGDAIE